MNVTPLTDLLLPEGPSAGPMMEPDLEARLDRLVAEARAEWPDVMLDEALFLPYVAARLPVGASLDAALGGLHAGDLYLACACVLGDPAALEAFERKVLGRVAPKLTRILGGDGGVDDLLQKLRSRLLVGEDGATPKLVSYSGTGDLVSWTRVVAVREALAVRRRRRPESDDDPEALEIAAAVDDPELELMRTDYQTEFRAAFGEAFAELEARDRNLLRYHLVDRLGIDRIAALSGVHRATAARWLARTRERLNTRTRRALMRRLGVDRGDLESIMRLIRSQLEVSIRRLLDESE